MRNRLKALNLRYRFWRAVYKAAGKVYNAIASRYERASVCRYISQEEIEKNLDWLKNLK